MKMNYKINSSQKELSVREKFDEQGIAHITNQELIMLILGSGIKDCPIDRLSWQVLNALDFKDSDELYDHLRKIKGIGKNKAKTMCACVELGKRLGSRNKKAIHCSTDVIPLVNHYSFESVEYFLCITINAANEFIKIHEISKGSTNSARIHPKEVFLQVLHDNGNAVIFVHNHPSGNTNPSSQDIHLTKMLMKGAKIIGIPILDHIILGSNGYFSMADSKLLQRIENEVNNEI